MRNTAVVILLLMLAGPAQAQSAAVTGKLGYLSEWDVTGEVAEDRSNDKHAFSGPLTVKHTGLCTPGRTVEMTGQIRYRVFSLLATRRIQATLVLDGTECGFEGKLADAYEGVLTCPEWRGVPLSLTIKARSSH
jgi:hypothetical protein